MTRKSLVKLFEKHVIYRGDKYIDEILAQIKRNEIEVKEMGVVSGELAIVKKVAVVRISYTWPRTRFTSRLVESVRRTGDNEIVCSINDGIGHKIRTDKLPLFGARRVFDRKLHMRNIKLRFTGRVETRVDNDPRFGVIPVVVICYYFEAKMPQNKFNPSGYNEDRMSPNGVMKHSKFMWIPDPSLSPISK